MEGNRVMYCAVCCNDTTHRYSREDNVNKFYDCLICETPNHVPKKVTRPAAPCGCVPVKKGNVDRVAPRR